MSKVIAAVDDSAAAAPVLAMAASLARALGATVDAVHVTDDGGRTSRASTESLGIPFRTLPGDPLARLTEVAAAPDVVAVTVGVRSGPTGRRRAGHLALGLADAVVTPVIAVPPRYRPPQRLTRLLIAVEGDPGRTADLHRAVQLARSAGLDVVVVHVDDETSVPTFSDAAAHETESFAREFLLRYCPGASDAVLELRLGVPADEILAVAHETAAQLLAVGWPRHPDPSRRPVATDVLQRSTVPILLVGVS